MTTVIKGCKRNDMWDYANNKPIEDTTPIGFVMEVDGRVPESYIKYEPNKIFDRRKYPDLYNLFGKDHLPTELELKIFVQKHYEEWHPEQFPKENKFVKFLKYVLTFGAYAAIFILLGLLIIGVVS